MSSGLILDSYLDRVKQCEPAPIMGEVIRVTGLLVESMGPRVRVGEVCELRGRGDAPPLDSSSGQMSTPLVVIAGVAQAIASVSTSPKFSWLVGSANTSAIW